MVSTWSLYTTIITVAYTANLTVYITLLTFSLPINSAEDIGNKNKEWVTNAANGLRTIMYMERNEQITYRKKIADTIGLNGYYEYRDDIDILKENVAGQNMLFIRERSLINHVMYKYYKERANSSANADEICMFVVTRFSVITKNRGFAYAHNFMYKDLFDYE